MSNLPSDLFAGLIRTAGFFVKEVLTVLRQPRLVASLVFGPFAILVLFGLGYRGPQPEFRTILVVPEDPSLANAIDVYREGFAGVFKIQGVTHDRAAALAAMRAGDADVVVVVPDDVYQQLYDGRQPELRVLYTETDPTSNAWVRYFTQVQTGALNRRILAEVLGVSRGPATEALAYVDLAQAELDRLEAALRSGDYGAAATHVDRLLVATRVVPGGAVGLLDSAQAADDPADLASALVPAIEEELGWLEDDVARGAERLPAALRRVEQIRARIDRLEALARRVNSAPIETLVSPLTAETENLLPVEPTAIGFYTPAVLALLIQHIGVTLSSLSAVRDRRLGSLELFRVSPVGAGQILLGKSLGYAVLLVVVGAGLTELSTAFLGVPSLGDPRLYWLSLGLTIFAAVALGFALAVFASTESQVVQLSMLVLLASIFLGGFFLPLELLFPWVRMVAYALPATHGAIDLRAVMLRGAVPPLPSLLGPLALGVLFYAVAIAGLSRQMRRA